jgi:hypothetical protein
MGGHLTSDYCVPSRRRQKRPSRQTSGRCDSAECAGHHYLVDGYAGLLLAAAFWWLACRIYPQREYVPPPTPIG